MQDHNWPFRCLDSDIAKHLKILIEKQRKHYKTFFGPPWTMNNEHVSSKFWIPLLLGSFFIAIGCHPSQTVDSVVIKMRISEKVVTSSGSLCWKVYWLSPGANTKLLLLLNLCSAWPDFQQSEKINMIWFYYLESLLLRTIWTSIWEKLI